MKLLKKIRFICMLFVFGSMLFSCTENLDLEKSNVLISKQVGADKNFNEYLKKLDALYTQVERQTVGMSKEEVNNFYQEIAEKSKSDKMGDIIILSSMIGYADLESMNKAMQEISQSIHNVADDFPELTKENSQQLFQVSIKESTFYTTIVKNQRVRGIGPSPCRNGYGACLINAWALGSAALITCAYGIAAPPWAAACAALVTVGTLAKYAQCYADYCIQSKEDFYGTAPAPIFPNPTDPWWENPPVVDPDGNSNN
jgi:hypothetical protein